MPRSAFYGIIALFILARLALFLLPPPMGDVSYYARFVDRFEHTKSTGLNFYEEHAREANGEYKDVEYPPLFLFTLRIIWWGDSLLVPETDDQTFTGRYTWAFQRFLMLVDALTLTCGLFFCRKAYPAETTLTLLGRSAAYLLASLSLFSLLFVTIDLIVGFLVLAALTLLTSRAHFFWSYLVLALSVNLKVTPIVLGPLWVLGSLPAAALHDWRRLPLLCAIRGVLLGGLIFGLFLPFYWAQGDGTLGFFRYHANRGLQLETVYATMLRVFDPPVEEYGSHGSADVRSSHSDTVLALAPILCAGLLAAVGLLAFRHVRRLRPSPVAAEQSLASILPGSFAAFALALMMTFVAANKVFSQQYLLWLAPLVLVAPLEGWSRRLFFGSFVVVCVLTTFEGQLFPGPIQALVPFQHLFLLLRNLLFVALTAAMVCRLYAWPFEGAAASSGGGPSQERSE